MNSAVSRVVQAHAFVFAHSANPPLRPNIFAGTAALCDDMRAEVEALSAHGIALRVARASGDLAALTKAQGDFAGALARLVRLNESLGQVLGWHAELRKANER